MSARDRIARLAGLFIRRPDLVRRDADDELAAVVDGRIADAIAAGMSPEEARADAMRRLGAPVDEAQAQLRQSALGVSERLVDTNGSAISARTSATHCADSPRAAVLRVCRIDAHAWRRRECGDVRHR